MATKVVEVADEAKVAEGTEVNEFEAKVAEQVAKVMYKRPPRSPKGQLKSPKGRRDSAIQVTSSILFLFSLRLNISGVT